MTLEAESQSQGESNQQVMESGPIEGQTTESTGEFQPGAEQSQTTYSQEDWDKREQVHAERQARSDQQVNQSRAMTANAAMRAQIQSVESKYQAQDQQHIEDGTITLQQANQRAEKRLQKYQQGVAQQQQNAQTSANYAEMSMATNEMARERVADLLAKEHGVDFKALVSDKSLTSGEAMEIKAQRMALDKERAAMQGTETFDAGQKGNARVSVANMSPQEKISYALTHPQRRR